MPTLVQALASRFRGGVQIVQVVALDNAGDCIEVFVSMDPTTEDNLRNAHPSKFVKLCAPGISAVWHPFTVYSHPNDPSTMRMMIRPIGQFTKKLRSALVETTKQPITLIDGFYRGDDHCQQAMIMHDHVSIICGGVARTPFLSMIFAVLKELPLLRSNPSGSTAALRSMTVIWSCRELGLLSYVKQNYLESMVRLANDIDDFEFKIKIYYTGKNTESAGLKSQGEMEEEVLTEHPCDHEDDLGRGKTLQDGITSNLDDVKEVNHQTITFTNNSSDNSSGTGHAMELGRMMPARYSRMVWNAPYFVAFTSSVWLGFHFMFYPYDYVEFGSYREYSEQAYITMLVIVFFFGVGCVVELSVLILRKYWPAPSNKDITVTSTSKGDSEVGQCKSNSGNKFATMNDNFHNNVGRPNSEDMLADASRASAPGLFVCGPPGMVQTLRSAAGVENAPYSFLTRYAIYEESFEM
jgi:ferredoxin-NADP reductase